MKKKYIKTSLISTLVLSLALLSAPSADASIFSKLKHIAQSAVKTVGKVVTNPNVQKAAIGIGKTVLTKLPL